MIKHRLLFLLFVILLSAWLAYEAVNLNPRSTHLADSVDSQSAILERRLFVFEGKSVDYPVWRNRLVIPVSIETLVQFTPLSHSKAYLLLRWFTACLALLAFASLLRNYLSANGWFIVLGLALFTAVLGPTFLHVYDIPSDFLDAAAMALLTQLTFQRRSLSFTVVFFAALLNREGALFALVPWFFINAMPLTNWRTRPRLLLPVALAGGGICLVQYLRWLNAISQTRNPVDTLQPFIPIKTHEKQFMDSLVSPHTGNPLYYIFGFATIFILLFHQNWSLITPPERRLVGVATGVAIITCLFGNIVELRTQMAALVWFTFLTLVVVHRRLSSSTRLTAA